MAGVGGVRYPRASAGHRFQPQAVRPRFGFERGRRPSRVSDAHTGWLGCLTADSLVRSVGEARVEGGGEGPHGLRASVGAERVEESREQVQGREGGTGRARPLVRGGVRGGEQSAELNLGRPCSRTTQGKGGREG